VAFFTGFHSLSVKCGLEYHFFRCLSLFFLGRGILAAVALVG
jgi:hypothetical protein